MTPHDPDHPGPRTLTVGLLADPDTPAEITAGLVDELPDALSARVDDDVTWDVRTQTYALTASVTSVDDVLDAVADHAGDADWDLALYVTDLPLQHGDRPILADLDPERQVAGLSLPAFGPLFQRRKVRQAAVALLGRLVDDRARAGRPLPPARLVEDHGGSRRYVTTPLLGRLRLLGGMVRTNQPWRLVIGMRSALAAVLATSAYLVIMTTTWQIATTLGVAKLAIALIAAVAMMVAWIVGIHHLWERPAHRGEREEVLLYNASTVATLVCGVLVMAAAVFVFDLVVSLFFLEPPVFSSGLGRPPGFGDYARLAWLATGFGTVAGALGSGLDSDDAVRQAAYGYRERQRRRQLGEDDSS